MKHLEGFPIFRFEHVSIHADKYPRWRSDAQFAGRLVVSTRLAESLSAWM
jgi:hypothetical protein